MRQFSTLPNVIFALLVSNAAIFLLQGMAGPVLEHYFALWPLGGPEAVMTQYGLQRVGQFIPWQLVTYAFLHGGLFHLAINMFVLWMFGMEIENIWGSRRFAIYYFICVVGAGLIQLVVATIGGAHYPTVGASGGVFGLLLAFAMMFPERELIIFPIFIPIKAKWAVVGIGAISLFLGVTGSQSGIAHFAHLGGMAFGFLVLQYWRGRLPVKPQWPWRW